MRQQKLLRAAVLATATISALGLSALPALAGDTNGNGEIDKFDTGRAVYCVQHVVHSYAGINIGPKGEDSDFGGDTERGVKIYQGQQRTLKVDGKVGKNTGHVMFVDVTNVHRVAVQTRDTALAQDTNNWLRACPPASSVFR